MVAGRTNEPRTVTITTTSGSAAVTAAAGTFERSDAGRTVTGAGIQAGTTILSVQSATAATLSLAASASGARSVALGAAPASALGFTGWSPESEAEADSHDLASRNAGEPIVDRPANATTQAGYRTVTRS